MTTIKAIINGRRLELDVPADWADGTEVEIRPLELNRNAGSMSAEEIERTLAAMDLVVPFDMSDAEEAAWEAERTARKEREKTKFAEHADELRRSWE